MDELKTFLSTHYKDNFLIFNFSYLSVVVVICSSLKEDISFVNCLVNFNMENISLDMIFRILYCIEYWNHNPKHYGFFF